MLLDHLTIGYVTFWIVAGILGALAMRWGMPSPEVLRQYVAMFNDRGGNIAILTIFSLIFFQSAMAFIYHIIALADIPGDTVSKSQAVVTAGLGFVTGGAFNGAFGALLKTMNPQSERSTTRADGTSTNGTAPGNGAPPPPAPDAPVAG